MTPVALPYSRAIIPAPDLFTLELPRDHPYLKGGGELYGGGVCIEMEKSCYFGKKPHASKIVFGVLCRYGVEYIEFPTKSI